MLDQLVPNKNCGVYELLEISIPSSQTFDLKNSKDSLLTVCRIVKSREDLICANKNEPSCFKTPQVHLKNLSGLKNISREVPSVSRAKNSVRD